MEGQVGNGLQLEKLLLDQMRLVNEDEIIGVTVWDKEKIQVTDISPPPPHI